MVHMLRAFEKGADGVCVIGCMEGDCHYNTGNLRARKRVEKVQKILETIGIEGERAQMYNLSSGEGPTFAKYATEMYERIKELGLSPLRLAKKKDAA
jgi:coenzyme F420-reducing hydrogenase delta subunit